jgi:hypothetical protein
MLDGLGDRAQIAHAIVDNRDINTHDLSSNAFRDGPFAHKST